MGGEPRHERNGNAERQSAHGPGENRGDTRARLVAVDSLREPTAQKQECDDGRGEDAAEPQQIAPVLRVDDVRADALGRTRDPPGQPLQVFGPAGERLFRDLAPAAEEQVLAPQEEECLSPDLLEARLVADEFSHPEREICRGLPSRAQETPALGFEACPLPRRILRFPEGLELRGQVDEPACGRIAQFGVASLLAPEPVDERGLLGSVRQLFESPEERQHLVFGGNVQPPLRIRALQLRLACARLLEEPVERLATPCDGRALASQTIDRLPQLLVCGRLPRDGVDRGRPFLAECQSHRHEQEQQRAHDGTASA